MKFKKITVKCSPETSEIVAYCLHEAGSMGEVFDDYADVKQVLDEKRWDYADATLFEASDDCSVSGFFSIETDETAVFSKLDRLREQEFAEFSTMETSVETIDSEAWENEWKKYYKPFNIGKIVIVPEWLEYNAVGGEIPVKLNPGLAFGTGMHETTSMCIDLMQRLELKNKRVLDFGCGSGILGVCATALGAGSVLFADTDEQAVTATAYNCKINGIKDPEVFLRDVRELAEPADTIVANITADVLTAVEPMIRSALKKGGHAIISGIISDKIELVKKAYLRDFKLKEHIQKNEWSAFLFEL